MSSIADIMEKFIYIVSWFMQEKDGRVIQGMSLTRVSAKLLIIILTGILTFVYATTSMAETVTREQISQMSQQVESIKTEVLDIANSMIQLNERVIFPEKSRVSLYVTFQEGGEVALSKVRVKIDGKNAVIHRYKPQELNALQLGGAQRIYTGNISEGGHLLEVAIIDSADDSATPRYKEFKFSKYMSPKVIEISIGETTFGDHAVDFRE